MSELPLLGHVVAAAVMGAVLGFEREMADKPAGLRTHMLVAAASALIVIVGTDMVDGDTSGDPTRPLHAVITGIGFLGAGTIMQDRGEMRVSGLTTAATLFTAAAVGVAVATSAWVLAIGVTAFFTVVSPGLEWAKQRFDDR